MRAASRLARFVRLPSDLQRCGDGLFRLRLSRNTTLRVEDAHETNDDCRENTKALMSSVSHRIPPDYLSYGVGSPEAPLGTRACPPKRSEEARAKAGNKL